MKRTIAFSTGIVILTFAVVGFVFIERPFGPVFLLVATLAALLLSFTMAYIDRHSARRIAALTRRLDEFKKLIVRKRRMEERLMSEMPVGIVAYNKGGTVEWANEAARTIFENVLEGRRLETLHKELYQHLSSLEKSAPSVFRVYGHDYDVIHDQETQALYFFRVGERETLKRQYAMATPVVGAVHLDNFNDAASVLDVQERNEIQGKLLGALDAWADEVGIHLVAGSVSDIQLFMQRKDLEAIIENRFSILDEIARISKENELMVTMSGGFACAHIALDELGELAKEALDLALSRGGDQVVINIQGEPLIHFGGNTNTQEKRTRISSRINAKKLKKLIVDADRVFVMPHRHPDADAFGAALGILKICQSVKKEAGIVLDFDALDKTVKKIVKLMEYEYVGLLESLVEADDALLRASGDSLLVLVDHHSEGQVLAPRLLSAFPARVVIDHHRKLSDSIPDTRMSYIEPYASSTTELIVEMMQSYDEPIELNAFEATVMLTGIIVDTNHFTYRTGARTFEAAAVLRKAGADTQKAKTILRESLKDLQIRSNLLRSAEVFKKRFSVLVVPQDTDCDRILLAQTSDELLEIDNTLAAFAIGRLAPNRIGISARSLEGVNVQRIMEHFGGGGHMNNAGAQIETDDIGAVKKDLLEYLETVLQEEKPMKVILKADLKNRGKKGEVIDVAPGYGNYLLTSKQAIEATPENLQSIEAERDRVKEKERLEVEAMKELKQRIDYRAVKLPVKIGETGKLYGKVSTKHIAEAMKEQHDLDIDKRKIVIPETIDTLGAYRIEVKLHKDVTASFELQVVEG